MSRLTDILNNIGTEPTVNGLLSSIKEEDNNRHHSIKDGTGYYSANKAHGSEFYIVPRASTLPHNDTENVETDTLISELKLLIK